MIPDISPNQPGSTPAQHVEPSENPETSTLSHSDESTDARQRKSVALQVYLRRSIDQNEKSGVTTGVAVMNLHNGSVLHEHNSDTLQFAASVNKIPIARLVIQDLRSGKITYDQVLTWTAEDVRPGAGAYDKAGAPLQATVKELLFDLLNPSGNTAVRALVNQGLGGAATVNARFSNELELNDTHLQPLEGTSFYIGNTTPREAVHNLAALLEGEDAYANDARQALATNIYTDYGVRTQLAGNEFISLANKVGILDDPEGNNRHDVGIIYNANSGRAYGYALMNTSPGASYNLATSQAGISLADMGRGILRFSGDKRTGQDKALRDEAPFTEYRQRY